FAACGARDPGAESTLHDFSVEQPANGAAIVSEDSRGLYVSVTATGLEQKTVTLDAQEYTRLSLAGFEGLTEPGSPQIPYSRLQIAVPNGVQVSLAVNGTAEPQRLLLDNDLSYQDIVQAHSLPVKTVARNLKAYEHSYGKALAEI